MCTQIKSELKVSMRRFFVRFVQTFIYLFGKPTVQFKHIIFLKIAKTITEHVSTIKITYK